MKKFAIKLSTILLLVVICLSTLYGCSTKETSEDAKDNDYLYNWLLENGELINGTALIYEEKLDENKVFALHYDTGYVNELFVTYSITDYEGYQLEATLPLFIDDDKVLSHLTLINADGFTRGLEYYHTPNSFTSKTPVEHRDTYGDTISMEDYPHEYVDGKIVVKVPDEDKAKIEELKRMNNLCEELSHGTLCNILDWLNEKICPLAEMKISDFGYKAYK